MNPSKLQKCEMESTSKITKQAYIQPGALARGRGKSLRNLGSLRVTAEQRTLIGKSKSSKDAASILKELVRKNRLVPPGFDPMEDIPPHREAEATQEDQRNEISPCEYAKAMKLSRKNIGKDVTRQNHGESIQNELPHKNRLVPPGFDPMEDIQPRREAEATQKDQRNEISPCESEKTKKVRGKNICKDVAKLKPGEKLEVTFYHNRVGPNHTSFSRHLGILVRDSNTCPLRVHSWTDIEEHKLEHMWKAVKEKFDSDDMNDHRDHVLQHMRKLWNNWRGSLHKIVKSKPLHEVLKDVPAGIAKSDWEWLVKEYFLSDKFKEASTRNSVNRSKLRMPHRTGSKPIREVIYEKGGKDGKPPDMATIFFETRKKDNNLVEPETNEKYAEMKKWVESEPSLTHIEVVEKCFGPQRKSHAVGFGGGITAKELKGGNSSKTALLEELKATRKEKESLQKRVDAVESRCEWIESLLFAETSSSPASSTESFNR